jgi:hypothetical protein
VGDRGFRNPEHRLNIRFERASNCSVVMSKSPGSATALRPE